MSEPRLWTGGRVFTGRRYAEAVLVDDGAVVAVGSETELRRSAPTGTERVPLEGRLVVPGLIDAHLHVGELTRFREGLNLTEVRDRDDLIERLRTWASDHPTGAIVGRGLDLERSLNGRWPLGSDLDRAVSDRPLVLLHASGHAAVANSAALAHAAPDGTPPVDLDSRFGRSADGSLNGLVFEEAVRWLTTLAGPTEPPGALVRTLDVLSSLGLTTVAAMNVAPEELASLRALAAERVLPLRVRVYVRLTRIRDFRPEDLRPVGPPGRFRVVGAKGFTDGAFGPRTAWLSEPYADDPSTSGLAVETDEELAEALSAAHEQGLAPALHAIGDRAVLRATRLLGPYLGRDGGALARIEHVGLVPPAVLSELGATRPALVVQPGFVWSDHWLTDRLGAERARWAYPFRTLADHGLLLAGSSDAPYDPPDPWRGVRAAIGRRDELGRSANPDPKEALALEEAVRLYTANAGTVLGDRSIGTLEAGARADLVVMAARDLGQAIREGAAGVRETWVDGVRVFPPGGPA